MDSHCRVLKLLNSILIKKKEREKTHHLSQYSSAQIGFVIDVTSV